MDIKEPINAPEEFDEEAIRNIEALIMLIRRIHKRLASEGVDLRKLHEDYMSKQNSVKE